MSHWLGVSIGIMSSDSDIPVSPVPSDRRQIRGGRGRGGGGNGETDRKRERIRGKACDDI